MIFNGDEMENSCINCKFYEAHRRARYPHGKCLRQFAYRIPDRFKIYLDIMTPTEFTCNEFQSIPRPIYVVTENETFIVPPIIADDLIKQGWVKVEMDEGIKIRKSNPE